VTALRVVLSQFYNEAYMLPWWLRHHREMFDHGVLIDSHSTDGSADICRQLVPEWEVVRPEYTPFETILRDFEIMKHEARFPCAWKIALNTTEFLVAPDLASLEGAIGKEGGTAARLPAAIMVDSEPDREPAPERPLVEQKCSGIWERDLRSKPFEDFVSRYGSHGRVYHRYPIGAYTPGRHASHLPGQVEAVPEQASIWWYGFSPWNARFLARKRQIGASIGEHDRKHGFGFQHQAADEEFDALHSGLARLSGPLFPLQARDAGRERSGIARRLRRMFG
jgi:hypothetical protein